MTQHFAAPRQAHPPWGLKTLWAWRAESEIRETLGRTAWRNTLWLQPSSGVLLGRSTSRPEFIRNDSIGTRDRVTTARWFLRIQNRDNTLRAARISL